MSLTGFQRRRRELEENKKIEVENELEQDNSLEVNYEDLKVIELKDLAKEKGIEGFEDMKKAELIQALIE